MHRRYALPIICLTTIIILTYLPISEQYEINTSDAWKSLKTCIFVVSTSCSNFNTVLRRFESYAEDENMGMVINIHHDDGESECDDISYSLPNLKVTTFPYKSMLWKNLDPHLVEEFEYVWFMDDDLVFDRKSGIFPFDAFLQQVRSVDAIISTPKIIRYSKETTERHGNKQHELYSYTIGEEVDFIEVDAFMFKSKAWIWFQKEIIIDVPNSAWGPDCIWCRIFRLKPQSLYGKLPCFRSLHYGIIHHESENLKKEKKSHKKKRKKEEKVNGSKAYKALLSEKFDPNLFNCSETFSNQISYKEIS